MWCRGSLHTPVVGCKKSLYLNKELQRSLGDISQKVLTENLRQLEARGILTRTVYEQVPPRVEYKQTELGQSMRTLFDALWAWGEHYQEVVAQS